MWERCSPQTLLRYLVVTLCALGLPWQTRTMAGRLCAQVSRVVHHIDALQGPEPYVSTGTRTLVEVPWESSPTTSARLARYWSGL